MNNINNIVVIGSGVMGAGIATQIANSNLKVHLLDIVPIDAVDRNILAKEAIKKISSSLALEEQVNLIIPGNIEDDLEVLSSADWIIEVIIEKIEFKQKLYKKLDEYCKKNVIISSNTSTIPLSGLIDGMSDNFKKNFLITHFFNPPRFMQLVELVYSSFTDKHNIDAMVNFLDINLGKTIVKSNDTPGFIANRIGCYWLLTALHQALEMNMNVEEVDTLMSKPLGIPATGVFGLYDLIGIDVMQLIINSLVNNLNIEDDFVKSNKPCPLVEQMIANNLIGRKGRGGFYRLFKDEQGNKVKEVINLKTGEYKEFTPSVIPYNNIKEVIQNSEYGLKVISKTLSYAANLWGEVSDSLFDIDQAMKLGYNWRYGPFELIDLIGPAYFKQLLEKQKLPIPPILDQVGDGKFYQQNEYFIGTRYVPIKRDKDIILLKDFKRDDAICKNDSASIWNMGEKIAVLEITSKMAILDHDIFNLILSFYQNHSSQFKALIIANDQANFSAGGNLKFMLERAKMKDFEAIEKYLKLGQQAMLQLKYSPIPVVSSHKGVAFGGGAEILLHSSAVVSHVESYGGLVEVGVGVIPGWGGCTELILRSKTAEEKINAFKNIILGNVFTNSYQLQENFKFKNFLMVMNINRMLCESKKLALNLTINYQIPILNAPTVIDVDWDEVISSLNLNDYNQIIAKELVKVFSATNLLEENLMNLEREIFTSLLHNQLTLDRMNHVLKTGSRLV